MDNLSRQYRNLARDLGYEFSDRSLLELALSHRSRGAKNNERLEFLGDSVLGFIISEALYKKFGDSPEGDLSRMRASLVRGKTLAEIAKEFSLGDYVLLGSGEMKSGGHRRESILADVVEAIIGAIYLESGFDTCRDCVLRWFDSRLAAISPDVQQHKDAKTQLQEWLQARKLALPVYTVVDTRGEGHALEFKVCCEIEALAQPVYAEASSRKAAEQSAAQISLEQLQQDRQS